MVAPAAVRSEDPSGHVGQVSEPWIGRSVPRVRVLPSTNSDAVTYARAPSGVKATPTGRIPTATVAITVLVAVLITETLFVPSLATYARVPSGVTATKAGLAPAPIGTVATTVLVAVLMTETVLS